MKAKRKDNMSTPFGGVVPVLEQIKAFGVPELIRECLGERPKQCKYSWEDSIIGWVLTNLCGGSRLAHIDDKKRKLNVVPDLKFPSGVTLGRVMKKLATKTETTPGITKQGKESKITFRDVNDNEKMCDLLLQISKKVGVIEEGKLYDLDIDAVFIETDNFEAKYSGNNSAYGFYPMIALIGDFPVYIEMRNGNVAPGSGQKEFMEKCLNALDRHNIKIGKVTADNASYNKELFEFLEERNIKFFVNPSIPKVRIDKKTNEPADVQPIIHHAIRSCDNFKPSVLESSNYIYDCELGDVDFQMYKSDYIFNLAIARIPIKPNPNKEKLDKLRHKKIVKWSFPTKLKGWKELDGYYYKTVITNDFDKDANEAIYEYMKRGASERKWDFLKNGTHLNLPPFSAMAHNTVFLYICAITNNLYKAIAREFSNDVEQVSPKARLETFIFVFMIVTCELINNEFVYFNTDLSYENIFERLNKKLSEKNS